MKYEAEQMSGVELIRIDGKDLAGVFFRPTNRPA